MLKLAPKRLRGGHDSGINGPCLVCLSAVLNAHLCSETNGYFQSLNAFCLLFDAQNAFAAGAWPPDSAGEFIALPQTHLDGEGTCCPIPTPALIFFNNRNATTCDTTSSSSKSDSALFLFLPVPFAGEVCHTVFGTRRLASETGTGN